MVRKKGQAMPIEQFTELAVRKMCMRWYRKGFREGQLAERQKNNPDIKYCRDCKWLCGDVSSVGIRCMNERRKKSLRNSGSAEYKAPSTKACKSGFEPREV